MDTAAPPLLNGRYRLGPVVGEGAMATVFRATDVRLNRTVAVKMLKPALAADPNAVRRFSAEACAAARLVDAHVVAIYDVLRDGAAHAIVMEFVDGPTLAKLLARDGPLPERQTIAYARNVARALSVAHANGIVHRDIKPANVLIAPGNVAKVTDFGIAKVIDAEDADLTERGGLVGTFHYFSPEQAQGLALSPASDLYSLGVVIYRAMTGTVPFAAASALAGAVAHVTEPAPSEAALVNAMSPGLASIVHRLLQKDPAQRFTTAGELDDALAALEGTPAAAAWDEPTVVGTIPVVPPRSARPAPAKAPWTFAVVAGGIAVLALAATFGAKSPASQTSGVHRAPADVAAVTVPDVRGMDLARAGAAMQRAGLTPSFAARVTNAPANTVIGQFPAAGSQAKRRAAALVIVSAGPRPRVIYSNASGDAGGWIPPGHRKHRGGDEEGD